MTNRPARLSINMNDETAVALRSLMEKRGATATEIIRRAVSVYAFVEEAVGQGKEFQLRDQHDRVERLTFL